MSLNPQVLFRPPSQVMIALYDEHGEELTGQPGYERKSLGDSWNAPVSWSCEGDWPRGPYSYKLFDIGGLCLGDGYFAVTRRPMMTGDTFRMTLDLHIGSMSLDDVQRQLPRPAPPKKVVETEYVDPLKRGRIIDVGEDES